MICTDCIHYEVCAQFSKADGANHEYYTYANQSEKCECFKDKSKLIQLPCKPLPVLKDSNPCNTDVYCPSCGENLSGYYVGSRIDIVVCFNCGEILDTTKATAGEKSKKGAFRKERRTNEALKPCPFCGGKATIICCDDEGNIHDDDYANDPWSGLGYQIRHSHEENEACPIARYAEDGAIVGGVYIYDTREEAIEAWNRRTNGEQIY